MPPVVVAPLCQAHGRLNQAAQCAHIALASLLQELLIDRGGTNGSLAGVGDAWRRMSFVRDQRQMLYT